MARPKKTQESAQTDIIDAANAAATASAMAASTKPLATDAPSKRAVVTQPFAGCPDGKLDPVEFVEGDEIEGDLAGAMIAAGFAKPVEG